jgi:vitamin B12 transporter
MKKTTLASLVGLLFAVPTYANEAVHTDDVIVTASRIPQSPTNVLADVTVIDHEDIKRAGQSTLVELLQMQPGVEISSTGGAGKSSSIFLRGTNSDHVVVLVDGLRINSATLGTTSFENIPLAQIDHIEILRGPASSLYGADAIGGVIQIFTKRGENGVKFNAFVGYGSYHTKTAEAGVTGGSDDTKFGINLSSFDTEGFSARRIIASNTPVDKDNDPYRSLSVSAYFEHTILPGHTLGLQFFQSQGHNNYDGGNNYANYGNETLQSYALISKNQFSDFWLSTLKLGMGIDDSNDQAKPSVSNPTGKSDLRTEQKQFSWQNDFNLPVGTLTLAYDRLEQRVSGSTNFSVKSRDTNGWLASYLADVGAHSVQISLRRDYNSQFGDHTTGGLAYGYRITPQWRASASYDTAFKAPTFNQLYFPNFGNPDLKPETSRNREAALRYETDAVHAGITVFKNDIENLIEFSGPPSGFNPVNVSKAEIRGATFDARWNINHQWTVGGNFTTQSPRRLDNSATSAVDESGLLIRRAQRHGAINLGWQSGALQLGMETVGTSERFNNATNTKNMGGYMVVNLTAGYAFSEDWKLEGRANNVLDKDYVLAYTGNSATSAAYETPGANLFVGLRWQTK